MTNIELDSNTISELEKLEKDRLRQKKNVRKAFYFSYPFAFVLGAFMIYNSLGGFFFLFLGVILAIPFAIQLGIKSKLTTFFKEDIMIPALSKLRPNITYLPGHGITKDSFNQSNLFNRPDRYSGEDLFQGLHEKTSFSFSEVHAEKKHKTKNGTSYSTIFKGLFMVADFNKIIKNETYVFTSGGKWFSKFKRVKLENPQFEENFNVYSDNEIEARYILTPSLMEKIVQLENSFNAQLFMSFMGSNVNIALKNKENFFERDLSQKVTPEMVHTILAELDACIEIIDDLDLNTRIWTKD